MARPQILLLGDSLTQTSFDGWGATLANVYQRRADVINRGYSGYNTSFYLRLPIEADNVCLALIFFGANDAALVDQDPHHHVPIGDYMKNLRTIIERVQEKTDRILLLTPPPVHHEQRLAFQLEKYGEKATGKLERTLENTGKYAAACKEAAALSQVPCLDIHNLMLGDSKWSRFLCDGLHFAADGHAFVGEAILGAINRHYPDLAVKQDPRTGQWCNSATVCTALSSQGPFHDEIDHKNIDEAFQRFQM